MVCVSPHLTKYISSNILFDILGLAGFGWNVEGLFPRENFTACRRTLKMNIQVVEENYVNQRSAGVI